MNDAPAKVSMFSRNDQGQVISRLRKCKNGHSFEQNRINPEWLSTKSDGARELYERDYEVDKRNDSRWLPGFCSKCRGRVA